jgi:hypothetical protein
MMNCNKEREKEEREKEKKKGVWLICVTFFDFIGFSTPTQSKKLKIPFGRRRLKILDSLTFQEV